MRTVHYVVGWPPDRFPSGIVTATETIVGELRGLGCDSTILAMNGEARADESHIAFVDDAAPEPFIASFARRMRARVYPSARILGDPANAIARRLKELHSVIPFDIIEMEESFGWGAHVARTLAAPVITRLHGPYFLTGAAATGGVFSADEKARIRHEGAGLTSSALVTSPSQFVLDRVREYYQCALADSVVIPNPVRAPKTEDAWRMEDADQNEILFVGRLDRIKGADILLRAFALLAASRPALKLTFAGPAEAPFNLDGRKVTRETLVAEIMPPEIAARITFCGVVAHSALSELRKRAFLTVVSSRFETFANVVLEAMAHGSPLIATEVGGIPEAARKDEDALLIPCDAEALASAIATYLDDPALAAKLGASGRRRALAEFSPRRIGEMTLSAYRNCIARFCAEAPTQIRSA